jgi:hypothetical protein
MRRHWEGVHAGVCQRIFSFTAQIVFVRHESPVSAVVLGVGATAVSLSSLDSVESSSFAGVASTAAPSSSWAGTPCARAAGEASRALTVAIAAQDNLLW